VPFLDQRLVKYVLNLPGTWKKSRSPKPLLLAAMRSLMPKWVSNHKKVGFGLPFERWLHSSLKPDVENTLTDREAFRRIGLEPAKVRNVWTEFKAGQTSWSRPWALYVLWAWCQLNSIN
jgi:asparagine synthase (glutamine-hydrolysing)